MTDGHASTHSVSDESVKFTNANAVTDPSMGRMDDAAGGPTVGTEQLDEPSDEEVAAQPGDFA